VCTHLHGVAFHGIATFVVAVCENFKSHALLPSRMSLKHGFSLLEDDDVDTRVKPKRCACYTISCPVHLFTEG
jgi:hypothetical protein